MLIQTIARKFRKLAATTILGHSVVLFTLLSTVLVTRKLVINVAVLVDYTINRKQYIAANNYCDQISVSHNHIIV